MARKSVGRPPLSDSSEVVQLRMPTELAKRLRKKKNPNGLSGEIRDRLVRSLEEDEVNASTRALTTAVQWIAEEIRNQTSPWSTNDKTKAALMSAIETWINQTAPSRGGAVEDLFGPDDPATLGRSIARHYARFQAEVQRTNARLQKSYSKGKRT